MLYNLLHDCQVCMKQSKNTSLHDVSHALNYAAAHSQVYSANLHQDISFPYPHRFLFNSNLENEPNQYLNL